MHNISEYFKYTPYDNKISQSIVPQYVASETYFRSRFLVEFPNQAQEKVFEKLRQAIVSPNIHTVLFVGASGSGKTTYLHQMDYIQKQQHGDKYDSDFFNLIERPTTTESNSILNAAIDSKILEVLDVTTVETLQVLIDDYMSRSESPYWNSIFLRDFDNDYHNVFLNFIYYNDYRHYSKYEVQKLCRAINNITEKIALYIIAFVVKKAIKNNRKSVLVFDNMDELSQEHLAEFLNDRINIAFSKAQDFFDRLYPGYCFVDNCTIIVSVRQSFTAYSNAAQLFDRYRLLSTTIAFDYNNRADLSSIIEQRKKLYLEQEGISEKERKRVESIFTLLSSDERFIKELGQLCNYDCRKTLDTVATIFENEGVLDTNMLKETDCRAGARGLLLFRIFSNRIQNPHSRFRMYADNELSIDGCNMNRMLFSLLANMSGTILDTGSNSINYSDARISLLDFTERIKKWYKDANVRYIYETILVSGNHNHSIPATLSGEIVTQFIADHQYQASLRNLCDFMTQLYETDRTRLTHVDIIVNPVSVAYANRVFIHYEYFNVLSLIYNKIASVLKHPPFSLFQLQTKDDITNCINRVYNTVSDVVAKSDKHFCSLCEFEKTCAKGRSNWRENCMAAINKFAKEGFLINNTLYTSRVITSHIRYLDVFRRYLWMTAQKNKTLVDKHLQMTVIDYIEKYISLYKTKAVMDKTIGRVIEGITERVAFAKGHLNEWCEIADADSMNFYSNGDY